MTKISENTIGFDVTYVHPATAKIKSPPFAPTTRVRANDGVYQWAVAGAEIAADNEVVSINQTTGVASASGGIDSNASGVVVALGEGAWFKVGDKDTVYSG